MEEITLLVDPCPKPRMTRSDKWKKRPCVVKYFKFCDELRYQAKLNHYIPGNSLSLRFVIKMPKSWSKAKKREMNGTPHMTRPDLDNLLKAFKDSLLKEDSDVHTYVSISKVWGQEGRIEIFK